MICSKCSSPPLDIMDRKDVLMDNKGIVSSYSGYSDMLEHIYLYQCPECKNVEIE